MSKFSRNDSPMAPEWVSEKFKLLKYEHIIYGFEARDLEITCFKAIYNTVFPRFSTPIRLQILISAPVRVNTPPSDKRLLQVSLDFDQKDGEPEQFLNQLTSKSLGLFFFIEYSVKYI